ncbi:MAG: phosphatidylglycerol lysyltransferase domain-containing protein [Muribaculaceae bacterium]|nr:phosphatidylglycerol lysyltransferase domain-containing protein [Muribaculaceae bacterium]
MDSTWNFTPTNNYSNNQSYVNWYPTTSHDIEQVKGADLKFRKINHTDMPLIWEFIQKEFGRTTDFSYGGILMWVNFFNYEYAILNDTLFIKGTLENDLNKPAFSLPIGKMSLAESVRVLKEYCNRINIPLYFSAVPQYAIKEFEKLNPISIEPLGDWSDYLYDAESLATLQGKKNGKKRNHVNKFTSQFPNWKLIPMTPDNATEALSFMDKFDLEGDSTEMAVQERKLTRFLIDCISERDDKLIGVFLTTGDEVCAFSIGDIKHDTFFVHVEKALREFPGSYEMINKAFAEYITSKYPKIKYINREDDAGDEGLRKAKQSYHPLTLLEKFNVRFS